MPSGMTSLKKFTGVYFRESEKNRFRGKPDQCFYINYTIPGKKGTKWEKIGWLSEGYSAAAASQIRADRIRAIRHGEALPDDKKDPFLSSVWKKYEEWVKAEKAEAGRHDISMYRTHLDERFGNKKLSEISPFSLEQLKKQMSEDGKAPATIKHALVVIRQMFNKARVWGMWSGENPIAGVKMPRVSNERQRFFTTDETEKLLAELEKHCPQTRNIAMLSLHTGLRAGEIFRLKWQDIDLENEVINVLGKNGEREKVFMTGKVKKMFLVLTSGSPGIPVFKARSGGHMTAVSDCFEDAVERLGFNEGVTDRLYKATFHTLRHTFGSWLALMGTPLLTIKELMRHKTIEMTMRYAKLSPGHKRDATLSIEEALLGNRALGLGSSRANVLHLPHHSERGAQT
jgi:integrase